MNEYMNCDWSIETDFWNTLCIGKYNFNSIGLSTWKVLCLLIIIHNIVKQSMNI